MAFVKFIHVVHICHILPACVCIQHVSTFIRKLDKSPRAVRVAPAMGRLKGLFKAPVTDAVAAEIEKHGRYPPYLNPHVKFQSKMTTGNELK